MEDDPEIPYSVLTRDDLKKKMKKQIENMAEIFCLSKSDATVLLMYLGWDSLRVSERLVKDKEKLFSESGLKSIGTDLNQNLSCGILSKTGDDHDEFDSSCGICFKTCDEIVDDDLISTSFCSHNFCIACWGEYLDKSFFSKNQTVISCPDYFCRAVVGSDTIENLTIRNKDLYEKYILRSYIQENKVLKIKMCPKPRCYYAIEFHEDENDEEYSLNVVCLCGHTFCWRCMLESHRPVTCNNASDWLSKDLIEESKESLSRWSKDLVEESKESLSRSSKDLIEETKESSLSLSSDWSSKDLIEESDESLGISSDWMSKDFIKELKESLSLSSMETNTNRCPKTDCRYYVAQDGKKPRRFLTCACRYSFCSKCLRAKEVHQTKLGFYGVCEEPSTLDREAKMEVSCLDSWKASQISMEEAETDLKHFEEIINEPSSLKEQDIETVREGFMLIIQCRQLLKWSCVYDYYHTDCEISKKEYLRFLQEQATSTLYSYSKTLLEETEGAFSASTSDELCNFRYRLSTATSNVGNYFYQFIKTLQDGLVDVKVKSYDNDGGPYWFCDRCTYRNTWLHKACEMCCDAIPSPNDLND